MDVKITRMGKINSEKPAYYFDCEVGEVLGLRNMVLRKNDKGEAFVKPPQEKGKDGKYYNKGFSFLFKEQKITDKSKALQEAILDAAIGYLREHKDEVDNPEKKESKRDDLPF